MIAKPIGRIDQLDRMLIDAIDKEGEISFQDLRRDYPIFANVPQSTLWYRINALDRTGLIHLERMRHAIICQSVGAMQNGLRGNQE